MKKQKNRHYKVFFDFDNTITRFDILDDIIKRFSKNKKWQKLEKAWKQGKIGSRECLAGQLKEVSITRAKLLKYLSKIKVDPYFIKLLKFFKTRGIRPVILSDSFHFIIRRILKNNRIKDIKIYCNTLSFFKDRLINSFPHTNKACFVCAHCKKNNLLRLSGSGKIIYIGDGRSDLCPAKRADLVFAKGSLLKHFKKLKRKSIAFNDLGDVYRYLRENW